MTATHAFHDRWSRRDLSQRLSHRLRDRLRGHRGRDVQPAAAIVYGVQGAAMFQVLSTVHSDGAL
jgi:hypothetical protein